VALLSDGLESTVNVIAAVIAYLMIGYASKPADAGHPFGHHKAEYFSAVIEGVLIVVAALLIVWEAVPAIMAPVVMEAPALGLAINFAAGVVNAIWAYVLITAGRNHRSPALSADGHHILSDVVTSIGVLVGLVLAIATGYAILDPLLAVVVACNILFQGWMVISRSIDGLMDRAVSGEEEEAIKQAIAANAAGSLGVHDLKTRQAGPAIFVDFHMVVPEAMPVGEAHDICDRIEDAIRVVHPGARIAIHVEPEGEKAHGVRVKTTSARH
jgi:cation diffusion facilitator family transporter